MFNGSQYENIILVIQMIPMDAIDELIELAKNSRQWKREVYPRSVLYYNKDNSLKNFDEIFELSKTDECDDDLGARILNMVEPRRGVFCVKDACFIAAANPKTILVICRALKEMNTALMLITDPCEDHEEITTDYILSITEPAISRTQQILSEI